MHCSHTSSVCVCLGMYMFLSRLVVCVAVKQTDCDCSNGRDCDEAACVLGVNNQHPSEVMGNREGGGPLHTEGSSLCVGGRAVGHCLLEPCIQ